MAPKINKSRRCLCELHGPDLATAHRCGCGHCLNALDAWTGHTTRRRTFSLPPKIKGLAEECADQLEIWSPTGQGVR